MGNAINSTHPLPQIWERINYSYLRHRLTHEIIEEHTLALSSEEQQQAVLNTLKKRITLHHMNIVKVIYFKKIQKRSICSQFQSIFQVVIYTEYTGDTLEKIIQEKGERMYYNSCQCIQILSASQYLKQYYGHFIILPSMIFLGNRKQKTTKIWINSKIDESQRQFTASQSQMCESLYKVLRYIKDNRVCSFLCDEHLDKVQKMYKLHQIKAFLFQIHKNQQDFGRHKKSNSLSYNQAKVQQARVDRIELNKKTNPTKASSMPQRSEENKFQKINDSINLKVNDRGDQNKRISSANGITINYPIANKNNLKNGYSDIFYRPVQNYNPLKINFSYYKPQNTNKSQGNPHQTLKSYKDVQIYNFAELNQSINNMDIPQTSQVQIISTPIVVTNANTTNNSPIIEKNHQDGPNFTAREMELPLRQPGEKITPARLPTTSRSPKVQKEQQIIKQQVPQIIHNRYQRKIVNPVIKQAKNYEKPIALNNSGNKFQKYKDAIKSYEEKLRQKFANSMGGQNPLIKHKNSLKVRKSASSPKGQFKQTKSVYNDSDDEERNQPIFESKYPNYQYLDQNVIFKNDLKNTNSDQKRVTEVSLNQIENNEKKFRQQYQKLELQKQLQKQKALIQSQMQDLLKQNTMRQQYRSIRQKIKQKKQTFAQLKAQATKILQDLEF